MGGREKTIIAMAIVAILTFIAAVICFFVGYPSAAFKLSVITIAAVVIILIIFFEIFSGFRPNF